MTTHKKTHTDDPRILFDTVRHINASNLLSKQEKVLALRQRFGNPAFDACYELALEEHSNQNGGPR